MHASQAHLQEKDGERKSHQGEYESPELGLVEINKSMRMRLLLPTLTLHVPALRDTIFSLHGKEVS